MNATQINQMKTRRRRAALTQQISVLAWIVFIVSACSVIVLQIKLDREKSVKTVMCDEAKQGVLVCSDLKRDLKAAGTTFPR